MFRWIAFLSLVLAAVTTAAGQTITLPHTTGASDSAGSQWIIHAQGMLQQQGNVPVFNQGARLQINGAHLRQRSNTGRIDPRTGEIVLDAVQSGTITLTRRIHVDPEGRYVRYADVLTNRAPRKATIALALQSNLNFGVNTTETLGDGEEKGTPLAALATVHNQRVAIQVVAGRSAKPRPSLVLNPGSNQIGAACSIDLGAGDTAVFVHLYATAAGNEAQRLVRDLRDTDILRSLPADLRPKVFNFGGGGLLMGTLELLRGDAFDIVELRGGDQLRGTIDLETYALQTLYGPVELPAARVIGLINAAGHRPRPLLVTRDGEIFSGRLAGDVLPLRLTSGQVVEIPLSQIARAGYRAAAEAELDAPAEPTEQPRVIMLAGDRMIIEPPTHPIRLATRFGALSLSGDIIAAIDFITDDQPVHQVYLRDGSRFAAVVDMPQIELKLPSLTGAQPLAIPTIALGRLQLAAVPDEPAAEAGRLLLVNEDLLVGELAGELQLDTPFATIEISAPQIAAITREADRDDVQITLWDGSTVHGRLQQPALTIEAASGQAITVPVVLVEEYRHPAPQPPESQQRQVRDLVERLNAEDFQERDRVQAQLVALGPPIIPTLRTLRPTQSPEAQQRIDQIIGALGKLER